MVDQHMLIREIKEYANSNNIPIMLDDGINFLTTFILKHHVRHVLEIGSAIGYSAIMMALVDPNITVTTVERDEKRYLEALKNIKKFKLEDRITLIYDDAFNVDLGDDEYDLIFIDAAKAQNIRFFEKFESNLIRGGYIITDNLKFHGLVEKDEDEIKIYCTFGLADEFGIFVATGLKRLDREDLIFSLAKRTKGWGRIAYVERLTVYSEEVRKWLLFEGYKCDIGIDHIVLECLEKGDLLGYIKENGWSEELYKASADMINAFCGISKANFSDYKDSKELVTIFVKESKNQKMNLESFSKLCDLIFFIKDLDKEEDEEKTFSDEEREELLDIIRHIAFEKGIDWDSLVRINPFSYHARNIAKTLGFDIWEDMYQKAKNDKHFDEWYALSYR